MLPSFNARNIIASAYCTVNEKQQKTCIFTGLFSIFALYIQVMQGSYASKG
jgi:hypothetical protein